MLQENYKGKWFKVNSTTEAPLFRDGVDPVSGVRTIGLPVKGSTDNLDGFFSLGTVDFYEVGLSHGVRLNDRSTVSIDVASYYLGFCLWHCVEHYRGDHHTGGQETSSEVGFPGLHLFELESLFEWRFDPRTINITGSGAEVYPLCVSLTTGSRIFVLRPVFREDPNPAIAGLE